MKTLLLTLISVSLVNNVVLSQFLGLCPFLGVSKKIETAAGMGGAVIFVITIASAVTSLSIISEIPCRIFRNNCVYSYYCSTCPISRIILKEIFTRAISVSRGLFTTDYNKLCRTWCGFDECTKSL